MAKFLNTSATNYFLEELIKNTRERLVLISPFLKLNTRIKELLEDKNRLKIDIRIVYGKSELQVEELSWIQELNYIRLSFCKNLHAKCYLNEESCIITSLNLYEFSQINNNEMGIFISRLDDLELYRDAYEEAQRIIRVSEEVTADSENRDDDQDSKSNSEGRIRKLTSSKIAQKHGLKTNDFIEKLVSAGFLEVKKGKHQLTKKGIEVGGESRISSKYGPYFLWPENLSP
jgi:phosphatidylserine/phosphatidylglycerophosphate/cardiolipin synthase-like enzyme